MSLAKGFARDGIGASLLGFEIFVRWTSLREMAQFNPSGKTRFDGYTANDDLVPAQSRSSCISGWTSVGKMVQI
ncbi:MULTISPECIES: hypothetical protein [Mesorhizobium]|uniref:hypothetical protein n=1 Tax=Mesorhizobium TaxID=68287 RepID=UPI0012EC6CFD|nr:MULTISPECIES: hypothetical protein [Mesorhizobium]WJI36592.1 hypothetical protein NL534_22175 [Mesorhizobium opportunistum]